MSITICCHNLEDTVINGKQRDIKRTTSKIKNQNILLSFLLVQTIGDGSGSGLVDDSHDGHARNGTSILGGLPLGIVEILQKYQIVF